MKTKMWINGPLAFKKIVYENLYKVGSSGNNSYIR